MRRNSTQSFTPIGNVRSLTAAFEKKSLPAPPTDKKPATAKPEPRGRDTERKAEPEKTLMDRREKGAREKVERSRSGSESPRKRLTHTKRTSDGLKDQVNRAASVEMKLSPTVAQAGEAALQDILEPRPGSFHKYKLNLKELKSRLEEVGSRQEKTTPIQTSGQESPQKVRFAPHAEVRTVARSRSQSPRKPLPKAPPRTPRTAAVAGQVPQDTVHSPSASTVAPIEGQAMPTAASAQTPPKDQGSLQATPRTPTTPRSPLGLQPAPKRLGAPVNKPNASTAQPTSQNKD